MADFKIAFLVTMRHEGGYSDHPLDRGSETYMGIARKFNPAWSGWKVVDSVKQVAKTVTEINRLLKLNTEFQAQVLEFYKQNYWDINRLGEIKDQLIANELFDTGVNMGTSVAARFLQEALNLTNRNQVPYKDIDVDGKMGPITINMTNGHPNVYNLFKVLNLLQGERYLDIMRKTPAQEVFANSWLSRVDFVKE